MTFSYKDLANYYGASRATFARHLKKLVETNRFKKTAVGDYFNEADARLIASLLGFDIKDLTLPTVTSNLPKKEIVSPNQINLVESIKEIEQEQKSKKFNFK